MKFTKRGDSYQAMHGTTSVRIAPEHGGWQVKINEKDVEWFAPGEIKAAKKWASNWMEQR